MRTLALPPPELLDHQTHIQDQDITSASLAFLGTTSWNLADLRKASGDLEGRRWTLSDVPDGRPYQHRETAKNREYDEYFLITRVARSSPGSVLAAALLTVTSIASENATLGHSLSPWEERQIILALKAGLRLLLPSEVVGRQ